MSLAKHARQSGTIVALLAFSLVAVQTTVAKERSKERDSKAVVEQKKENAAKAEQSKSPVKKDESRNTQSRRANTSTSPRTADPAVEPSHPDLNSTSTATTATPTAPATGEQIKWQVLSGGGSINSTSTNYRLSGTVGQVAAGSVSSSSYTLRQGFWQDFSTSSTSCCEGVTGDVNSDDNVTLTDLTLLVNQLFVTFAPVPCKPEANTNGDAACNITLTDLTVLVNRLFVTFDPTAPCSAFDNSAC